MSLFFRWTRGVTSRIDAAVRQIENHDALVGAAIRDAKEARARAKVQLRRVRDDGRRMQRRCAELEQAEARWRERARRLAPGDEDKALECVRRMKHAAAERAALAGQRAEHERIEAQLGRDIARIDGRIEQLVQQRNVMRTRQSRAEALAAAQHDDGCRLAEVDEVLDRWEVKIARSESDFDCALGEEDGLELELSGAEERDALRGELDALLREDPGGEPG